MKAKLFFSWVVLLVGAIFGANLSYRGPISADPLAAALSWGYVFWALYWGVPAVWRRWHGYTARYHRSTTASQHIDWFLLGLFIPLVVGFFYGIFGGAIYQCLRTWWKVRSRSQA